MGMMRLIRELRRRRVFRLAGIYLIGAWVVLQIADVTFEPIGLPAWTMTALIWLVVVGFPVSLLLSWRYDITSEGLVRIEADGLEESAGVALKPSDYAILAGVFAVAVFTTYALVGVFRTDSLDAVNDGELALRADAVAVLPFVNLSSEMGDEYFSDGVAEEILNALTQISQLKVIARTSSFAFRNKEADIREVARRLGAKNIVEGSVRRAGDRLRITAQLIDASSGTHMWSNTYDRELGDVFTIQIDIAKQIVSAMRRELNLSFGEPALSTASTANIEAYDHYLHGIHYYWQRGKEPVERAIEQLRKAVELDSEFAAAWAALAGAYNVARAHRADIGEDDPWDLAEAAAQRAVELDEGLAQAWLVLANVQGFRLGDTETGVRYIRKALEADPNNLNVIHTMSEGPSVAGLVEVSLDWARRGYEVDPNTPLRSVMLGRALLLNGQFDRALEFLAEARERGYFDWRVWTWALWAKLESGDFDAAERWLVERPFEVSAATRLADQAYLKARRQPSAENVKAAVDRIMVAYQGDEDGPKMDENHAAYLLVSMGAIVQGFELLEMEKRRGASLGTTKWWLPSHREFRQDPRFVALVKAEALEEIWFELGWPEFCSPLGDSFTCH
jgi:TolB-like protein